MSLEEVFLQVTTEELPATATPPAAPTATSTGRRPVRNITGDRGQGAALLLRLADCLHHHRLLPAAVRRVLLPLPDGRSCAQSLQMAQFGGGR